MKKNALHSILLLICVGLFSGNLCAQTQKSNTTKYHTESNGFKWIEEVYDGKCMAIDDDGYIVIPLTRGYEKITFQEHGKAGWFLVEKNGKQGACDITGVVMLYLNKDWEKIYVDYNNRLIAREYAKNGEKEGFVFRTEAYLNYQGHLCSKDRVNEDYLYTANGTLKELVYRNMHPYYIFRKDGVAWSDYGTEWSHINKYYREQAKCLSKQKGYNDLKYDKESEQWYLYKDGKVGIFGVMPRNSKKGGDTKGIVIPFSRDYDKILIQLIEPYDYCYYLFLKNGMMGACDSQGSEIVKPNYTALLYDEMKGFVNKKDEQWVSIGVFLDAHGKGYKSSENLFYKYVEEGDKQMQQSDYSAAISSYEKAANYSSNKTVWNNVQNNMSVAYYNLGVANYNRRNYDEARILFNKAESYSKDQNLKSAAKKMSQESFVKDSEISAARTVAFWNFLASVGNAMVDVINNGTCTYNPSEYSPYYSTSTNSYDQAFNQIMAQTITQTNNYGTVLVGNQVYNAAEYADPTNYGLSQLNSMIMQNRMDATMRQAAQQEYERELISKFNIPDLATQLQNLPAFDPQTAWFVDYGMIDLDGGESFGNEYNGKLSPEQYESAYRSYESSAQSYYNALTSGGIRSQDGQGNIQGKTVGQMAGGTYVSSKQGLRKAQENMRRIRQEAAQYGVNIPQSQWETATAGY